MRKHLFRICAVAILITSGFQANATHIRAGEITATRLSTQSLTFLFQVTAYTDTGSTVEFGNGTLNFGDGTEVNLEDAKDSSTFSTAGFEDEVAKNVFYLTHTFPANGLYTVSYREQNRNDGILTMSNSVNTPFYIETQLNIDPFFGINNTPVLLVPPVDKAATGARFIHNPGAFDIDGDSLAYKLVINKQDRDLPVDNFTLPNIPELYAGLDYPTANEAATGLPTYTLDSITGDLVWDAPGIEGEYNTAFIVEEWRKIGDEWFNIGFVTRDMQIIVEETDNQRPKLRLPQDTCIVAGSLLKASIFGLDDDFHNVRMESFGGVYQLTSSAATYTPNPVIPQASPGRVDFEWQTSCLNVRTRPYEVQFKVTDIPPALQRPSLTDIQTWRITVIAPAPEGLQVQLQPGRSMALNWDPYVCGNAEKIQIWRKINSYDLPDDFCLTGIPEGSGYELVGEVNAGDTTFLDQDLSVGVNYCYRLVATFQNPLGGESIASTEVCETTIVDVPVITNVSVLNTDQAAGEIFVRWTSPLEIDQALFPPPYRYELFRAIDFNGNDDYTFVTSTSDTTFNDLGLNTSQEVYNYRVLLYDASDALLDSSSTASSVWLDLEAQVDAIALTWSFDVPWSNQSRAYPYHYVYRDDGNGGAFQLIDSVDVTTNGFRYTDNGQFNNEPLRDESEYCYFVTTKGAYGNPIILEPLLNDSQKVCAIPNDEEAPCVPLSLAFEGTVSGLTACEVQIQGKPCDFDEFVNSFSWDDDRASNCDDDVRSYNIYFSTTGEAGSFELLDNVNTTSYDHEGLTSLKGCYQVAAVDRSGNESTLTEMICNDNCPNYDLPNVFTPNGDNSNDTFAAYTTPFENCPRFVETISFIVFNRWGKEVYSFEGVGQQDAFINWNGEQNNGTELSAGIYYYTAVITFDVFDEAKKSQEINGWIQLVR